MQDQLENYRAIAVEFQITLSSQETRTGKFKSTLFLDRAPTRRLKTGIAMYMPGTAKVSYKSQYDKTPIGALTGQAINAYNNLAGGRGREGLANILDMDIGVKALGTHPLKSIKDYIGEESVDVNFGGVEFIPGQYVYSDEDGIIVSAVPLTSKL